MNFASSDLYLVQDGGSLGSLSLPEQHQASDDVTGYDVQIPEELGEEARHLRVGVLRKHNRTKHVEMFHFLFSLLKIKLYSTEHAGSVHAKLSIASLYGREIRNVKRYNHLPDTRKHFTLLYKQFITYTNNSISGRSVMMHVA